jgi:two-component sensor histidine kinase
MTINLPTPTPTDALLDSWVLPSQPFAGTYGNRFAEQLRQSCLRAISGFYHPGFVLHLAVICEGDCPEKQRPKVLIAAAEMTANAMKHGLYERSFGQIEVHLTTAPSGATWLDVYDNGWGFVPPFAAGRGWGLLRALGTVSVRTLDQRLSTLVRLQLGEGATVIIE